MRLEPQQAQAMTQSSIETDREIVDDSPLYVSAAKVVPQKVHGTFRRIKWALLVFCLAVYYLLPFARWDRGPSEPHQAVLVDLAHSRFYFFFIELWPQEVYYFTGLLILAALSLFLSNALFGRVWCGYFCWQTVWTDMFIAVERWIEGDRGSGVRDGPAGGNGFRCGDVHRAGGDRTISQTAVRREVERADAISAGGAEFHRLEGGLIVGQRVSAGQRQCLAGRVVGSDDGSLGGDEGSVGTDR